MFKKIFGNPKSLNGPTVSSSTTTRTVDAIHKLTEVSWRGLWRMLVGFLVGDSVSWEGFL